MQKLFYKSNGTQVRITIPMIIKQNQRDIEHHEYLLANRELPKGRVASIKRHIERCKESLSNHLNEDYINNTYIIVEETA